MTDPAHLALFAVIGLAVGWLGGLFGIGGGLIIIPVLGLAFGLDQQHAQGTALAMVAPNILLAIRRYARHGSVDRRVAIAMAAAAIPATYAGAEVAVRVPSTPLRIAFAVFLTAVACASAVRALAPDDGARRTARWGWSAIVGAIGGALSGLFSVGGAIFAVPVLAAFFGYTQAAAQGVALTLIVPGLAVSLLTYARAGDIVWPVGLALAAGGFFGVRHGVDTAHRMPERTLRLLFSVLLLISALGLVVRR